MGLFDNIRKAFKPKTKSFLSMIYGGTPSFPFFSKTGFLQEYQTSLYLNAGVRARAEKVGEIDFKLYRGNGDTKTEVTVSPYLDLLYHPNSYQTKNEFFELYQTMKDLTGEVYVWMVGRATATDIPEELHVLRSDRMKIEYSEDGKIERYKYKPVGKSEEIVFQPEEILFSMYYSPDHAGSTPSGTPLAKPASQSISIADQLNAYQNNVLQNGGRVEAMISVPADTLTEEQRNELKEEFVREYAGAQKAGRPFIAHGGIEYKPLGMSMSELAFSQSKKDVRDDILMALKVPKVLVAQTDDVNRAVAETARLVFLQDTIKPLLRNLTQKLNEFLVPQDFELQYIDPTPEDEERKQNMIESGLQFGYMTINEARQEAGLDPVQDGDQLLVPMNKVPLGDEPQPLDVQEAETRSVETKEWVHPLRNKVARDLYRKQAERRQTKWERKYASTYRKYNREQEERILSYLTAQRSWKKKNIIDEGFNSEQEVSILVELIEPLVQAIALEVGQETFDLFDAGDYTPSEAVITTLEKRVRFFAQEVTDTTFKELQTAFAEALELGEGQRQLVDRIKGVYKGISDTRAKTIAVTESHTAIQKTIMDGYQQAGVPIKIWVAVGDAKTRPSHLATDGEEQMIDARFSNGLIEPGDPDGPASEVINCRCTI